jgi:hypothetical protein
VRHLGGFHRYVKESRLLVKVAAFGDAMAVKVAADQLLLQPKRGQQNPGSLAPSTERTGGSCLLFFAILLAIQAHWQGSCPCQP